MLVYQRVSLVMAPTSPSWRLVHRLTWRTSRWRPPGRTIFPSGILSWGLPEKRGRYGWIMVFIICIYIYMIYVYVHVFILICSNIPNNGEYPIVHNNYGASLGFNWDWTNSLSMIYRLVRLLRHEETLRINCAIPSNMRIYLVAHPTLVSRL